MDGVTWISLVVTLVGIVVGLAGIVVGLAGIAIAWWQWHQSKKQGERLHFFLLGLKAGDLPEKAEGQVNDMLEWLKK
jgi:hypothetical protein